MPHTPMREDVKLLKREDSDGVRNGVRRDFEHGVVVVHGKPRSKAFCTLVPSRCNPMEVRTLAHAPAHAPA